MFSTLTYCNPTIRTRIVGSQYGNIENMDFSTLLSSFDEVLLARKTIIKLFQNNHNIQHKHFTWCLVRCKPLHVFNVSVAHHYMRKSFMSTSVHTYMFATVNNQESFQTKTLLLMWYSHMWIIKHPVTIFSAEQFLNYKLENPWST